ncbi:MAG: glycosyltransferase family 4 protein [candidate division WS1 bacterium]|jgi:phosphatidylinositol alpha-1,6-mannosyltransferase|nr:glycosyltransferase family 4 protein [candidate division WS1 bacterium]
MSIIILADDFPPELGGIQTYACELSRALAELGEEVAVVASQQEGAEEVDAQLPFPVLRVSTGGGYPVAAMNLSIGARQMAAQARTPVRCMVATKWAPEGPAAILAFSALRCPMLLIGHGGEFSHTGGSVVKWLVQRVVLRRMSRFLANSHYTAELFAKARVPRDRIGIIYGGVRLEAFDVTQQRAREVRDEMQLGDRPLLLSASRLVTRKGHDTVLRALPAVLERFPDALYLVAGTGPLEDVLRALVDEIGVGESVRFCGRVADEQLPALYAAADIFVMPSRPVRGELAEGLGLAYLEAAAAGTPSIGTNFGGIPDAIADGETGLLVEPDDHEALGQAIVGLLEDDARREEMGQAARQRVREQYTWQRVAERFLEELATLENAGAGAR